MYAQVEKQKENKSRAVANSVHQNKNGRKQSFGFVDKRSNPIVQINQKVVVNNGSQVTQWISKLDGLTMNKQKMPKKDDFRGLQQKGFEYDGEKKMSLNGKGHSQVMQLFALTSKTVKKAADGSTADTRLKVGIGEKIKLEVDTGAADWTIEKGGGALSTDNGVSTVYTASHTPTDSAVIKASIVNEDDKTKDFEVIKPSNISCSVKSNPGWGTLGNVDIGMKTLFDCVVTPTDVNFHYANFRENKPGETPTAPSGYIQPEYPKSDEPWDTRTYGNNATVDTVCTWAPIGALNDGSGNQDWNYTVRVPEQYKDGSGSWVTWLPNEVHHIEYKGSNQKGRAGIMNVFGTWQGPWS